MAPRKKYSQDQMNAALEAVARGIPVATAAKIQSVPRVTLMYKSSGRLPTECRIGPSTVLTTHKEDLLEKWILSLAKVHHPVNKEQLLDSVSLIVQESKRPNPFANSRPGRKWYDSFMKRHPNLSKGRQSADKKGNKSVYKAGTNDEKENLTVLVTANAAGELGPPMIISKYESILGHIALSVNEKPCIQTSENIPSQGQIVPNEVHNPENLHGIETISQKSRHSQHSTTSSIRSRRRELALNMEKAKQEIEIKKLELDNTLKLLQIEREFHEQEINETRECESIKSTRSLYPTVRVLTPISQPPSSPKTTDIQNWVNEIEIQPTQDQEQPRKEDPPTVPREMTDIQLLCKTLSETFQKATSRPEDNFRITVVKQCILGQKTLLIEDLKMIGCEGWDPIFSGALVVRENIGWPSRIAEEEGKKKTSG
ncbi:hypothetical protein JTB14_005157 [Gonioctena quinquepunctata]|nr:hypothetical protein JTB14_005157 [Gonioctena quinquepunctata]